MSHPAAARNGSHCMMRKRLAGSKSLWVSASSEGNVGLPLVDGVAEHSLQGGNQPKHGPGLMAWLPAEFSDGIRMDRGKSGRARRKAEEVEQPRSTRTGVP